ncbi:MAG TPA: nicotinate-nucleotide diphosphorylase (carboxylating), partial [Pseudomonadales bacterium]|nr:nicotinate-nucleotide diphosphorylase (carboxylating) [Pseudomonadales bacterium]
MLDWNQICSDMKETVRWALAEDIGSGDITALLIPEARRAKAVIVCKESGVLSGLEWVNETYRQLSPDVTLAWHFKDGAKISTGDVLVELEGPARALLTGERTGLNFLQTLSGVATRC